ncbi:pentapeptide repeat-containing protein [Trebonia kvetii]|uniref:Pentapeptide repeat-containing protein n=2 Tax=Trebonia kvetii TaxID=2480626 RepID=A0A6P2BN96_9ACTN|nr:pentapeptide repeat-containing protein [Trebonia kvetii]
MRVVNGLTGMRRGLLPAIGGAVVALAGVLVLPAVTAAAAACPAVDAGTGAVSPAPAPGVNWSGCDLTGANLTGANLTGANLSGANLYQAVINSANFTGATLTGLRSGVVTFQSAPTLPANWTWIVGGYLAGPGADLAGAQLQSAFDLKGIDLAGADLTGANFTDATVPNVDFTGANLDNATLTSATLTSDTLTSATLVGANFNGALVEDSNLAGANLSASTGGGFSGDDLTNANLTGANLSYGGLTGSNLTGARLVNADLTRATLTGDKVAGTALAGATLSYLAASGLTGTPASLPAGWSAASGFLLGPAANLAGLDMTGANLAGANLTGASLAGATLTGANLAGTILAGADLGNVASGSLAGKPASLPAHWSAVSGFLFGPTADLYRANLAGVNFGSADLHQASMGDARLKGANLGTADMALADMTGVTSGAVVPGQALLPGGTAVVNGFIVGPGADLEGANLAGFRLRESLVNTDLAGADLENTDFSSNSLPGTVLSNADLTGANFTDSTLTAANLGGANLSGATLYGVVSGRITGTPAKLPAPWQLLNGYLVGPRANLAQADLSTATFVNADLVDANIDRTGLPQTGMQNTICPDGTNSDNDGGTCDVNWDTSHGTPPVAHPAVAGRLGAGGWYTSPVTVTWNWTVSAGLINTADCTSSTTSTSEGRLDLGASCANWLGPIGTAVQPLLIDTTAPQVTVKGIANGKVYPLGSAPVPACATTDSLSGVASAAKLTVTGTSTHGTGSFTATCAGATNKAGLAAKPVTVPYSVGYRFGGMSSPKPGSTLPKSTRTITVHFALAGATGKAIAASWAAALAKAGQVRVAFAGPGVSRVTAGCSWKTAGYFLCSVKVPAGIKTGKSHPYAITALERLGAAFVPVPVTGKTANPATIHFG